MKGGGARRNVGAPRQPVPPAKRAKTSCAGASSIDRTHGYRACRGGMDGFGLNPICLGLP
jgi:hypothetical protein